MSGRDRRDFGGVRRKAIAAPNNMQVRPQHDEIEAIDLARHPVGHVEHGDRRVSYLTPDGGKRTLADHFEGKRFNSPNDLAIAANGDVYFTDPPYGLLNSFTSPDRELDYTGVFRLNPDNSVTLIDRTLRPNGIGLSPTTHAPFTIPSNPIDLTLAAGASSTRVGMRWLGLIARNSGLNCSPFEMSILCTL